MKRKTKPARKIDPRAVCVQALCDVVERRRYLDAVLEERLAPDRSQSALIQEMAYGTVRWYHQLNAVAAQLLERPIKDKDQDLKLLLLLGLYQLRAMRVAPHAVVDETVDATDTLGKPWARGLINACLRNYLRNPARADGILARNPEAGFSHPAWLIDIIKKDHPDSWERILQANNERPPMTLRVNLRKQTRAAYLERLRSANIEARALDCADSAVMLEVPVSVTALPGFAEGEVSVQDASAQLAALLLDAPPGARVLDACAAPGGKTAHLLERTPDLELIALDVEATRVAMIQQNLKRLGLSTTVLAADATDLATWWDERGFERILVDVPCSATGVIRRHPDIKLRRLPEDLDKLTATQARILDSLWPLLRPGGKLLYVTCSVLAVENEHQIAAFLARHPDAREVALELPVAEKRRHGVQILPGADSGTMDGFFYACLSKPN